MARRVQPHMAAAVARAVLLLWVAVQSVDGECISEYCCDTEGVVTTCIIQSNAAINLKLKSNATVQESNIIGGREVLLNLEFSGTAVQSLRRLHFSDMQLLDVKANTEAYFGPNRDISMAVRNVSELRLRTSAFHGWQSELATLSVSDTDRVYIETDAFPPSSTFGRVQFTNVGSLTLKSGAVRGTVAFLQLKNIKFLTLNTRAINGNIETLSVEDAAADKCSPLAIGGSAGAVSLRSVTVTFVQPYCVHANSGWHRLTIEDCTFKYLMSGSVLGTISSFSISDSRIGSAGLLAVEANTTEFSMSDVTVGQLGPGALRVRAAASARLNRLRIDDLSRDALSHLRVDSSPAGSGVLAVSGLSVGYAAPGALRFAAGTAVTLTDLELRGGCVCGSPSWARQLLLGTSSTGQQHVSGISDSDGGDLTDQQAVLLRQIEAGVCTVEGVSLAEFTSEQCDSPPGSRLQP